MRTALLLATLLAITGCHAKFKKYASTLGTVKVQVINTGGPYVELGKVHDPDAGLVGAAINVVQTVKGMDLAPRIAAAVQVPQVNDALVGGLVTTIGSGPPFGVAPESASLLQIEMESYGLYVPYLGAPGQFTYTALATVYKQDGERIYRNRLTCTAGVGDPDVAAVVFSVVNNVAQIDQMTDEQINQVFVETARYCGQLFVTQMRKHAG